MPALDCKCGERIIYGDVPCKSEWLFISDVDYDGYEGDVDAELLYRRFKSFLRCSSCGRIWVFWEGFHHEATEYSPGGPSTG